jgi:hypothetical protein
MNSVAGKTNDGDDPRFSNHARRRARQRGLRAADLMLLLFIADREAPVGGGCVALSISCTRRHELLAEGYLASAIERVARIAAVQSADGEIVTVLRPHGRRGKRYRRAFRARRPITRKSAFVR